VSRRRRLSNRLYESAQMANDLETLASGNPQRIMRRVKNKLVGGSWVGACSAGFGSSDGRIREGWPWLRKLTN
jgi:hypothetical protein